MDTLIDDFVSIKSTDSNDDYISLISDENIDNNINKLKEYEDSLLKLYVYEQSYYILQNYLNKNMNENIIENNWYKENEMMTRNNIIIIKNKIILLIKNENLNKNIINKINIIKEKIKFRTFYMLLEDDIELINKLKTELEKIYDNKYFKFKQYILHSSNIKIDILHKYYKKIDISIYKGIKKYYKDILELYISNIN